jgi:hypothetical protein
MALVVLAAACAGGDAAEAPDSAARSAAESAGAAPPAAVAQAGGEVDAGGRYRATMAGALAGEAESGDATFCATERGGMRIFVLSLVDARFSVTLISTKGMPAPGTHAVGANPMEGLTGTITDRTTGGAENQQYKAESGTLVITEATDAAVEGTFTFSALPQTPRADGPAATTEGSFAATAAESC